MNRKSSAVTVLCCGDSNVYGYDPTNYTSFRYPQERIWTSIVAERAGWKVVNCGLCGREIPTRARQFEAAAQLARSVRDGQACAPEQDTFRLWISLGTNDLLKHGNFLAEDVAARMGRFLEELLERGAARPEEIRLIVPPAMGPGEWTRGEERLITQSRRLNEVYAELAGKIDAPDGIACTQTGDWDLPLVYDGVHLSEEGHRLFARKLLAELRQTE